MRISTNSRYVSYELTEEEELRGALISVDQRALIQNRLSACAEELLNIKMDPQKIQEFIQQQAYVQGKLDALQTTLDLADAAVQHINAEREDQLDSTKGP